MAKKNDEVTKLTEELLINRKNGTFQVSDEKLKKRMNSVSLTKRFWMNPRRNARL